MESVYPKTVAEYAEIKKAEQTAREARIGQWPEFSEYTDRYTLGTRTTPELTGYAVDFGIVECCPLSVSNTR